ncbi:MAG: glutaredoxin family protein [Acidobacteriota bacterium]
MFRSFRALSLALFLLSLFLPALPAQADWLITLEGKLIETQGAWTIEGDRLTYTDTHGEVQTLAVDDVDIEASAETTALRAGKPYEPGKMAAAASGETQEGGKKKARKGEKPKVIVYMTTLCKQCALAEELLQELGVDYIAKDVNDSKKARREFQKKTKHGGGGLPVLDIGGSMVYSYNPRAIRQRVEKLLQEQADNDER